MTGQGSSDARLGTWTNRWNEHGARDPMVALFHHVLEIETDAFLGLGPRPDAINEGIGGDALAHWLHARLLAGGYACHEVTAQDHGWDFDVALERRRYRIVSSCDVEADGTAAHEHTVQVAQTRGDATDPDPLLSQVRALLAANAGFVVLTDEARRRR